jgi:hypothetical protein
VTVSADLRGSRRPAMWRTPTGWLRSVRLHPRGALQRVLLPHTMLAQVTQRVDGANSERTACDHTPRPDTNALAGRLRLARAASGRASLSAFGTKCSLVCLLRARGRHIDHAMKDVVS